MTDWYQSQKGACLLVGNAPNLHLTPPECFDLPAFGMNTIHEYEGWMPNYYVTVDQRVLREFGEAINQKFRAIPKFMPTPHLDGWQGENIYRFNHLAHELWDERHAWKLEKTREGFAYHSAMHATMQIAALLGYTTLLMIGVQHKPGAGRQHFWGEDEGMPLELPVDNWLKGYEVLAQGMRSQGIEVLNISEDTYVGANILPRDNWMNWRKL